MPPEGIDPAAKCPVDHRTRAKWLEAARATGQTPRHPPIAPQAAFPTSPSTSASRYSLDSGAWVSSMSSSDVGNLPPKQPKLYRLSTDREISTIPRAANHLHALNAAEKAALPANSEQDSGHDRSSGNWIYPSQDMFFNAMTRKGHAASATDMPSIVPIHNAVNEKVWTEIKAWEAGRGSESCGGPKLISFSGDSKALTPRARWNALVGYQPPFDRHDWVVDRCGKRIEYVIDFYEGKGEGLKGKTLNFYLDVRPKVNSWEGIKMRLLRSVGM